MKNELIDTIDEVTNGELLSAKDLDRVDTRSFGPISPTTYVLEQNRHWHRTLKNAYKCLILDTDIVFKEQIVTRLQVEMPVIKGYFIKEIALKWMQAEIYTSMARRFFNGAGTCGLYQENVILYSKAAEIYKNLVNDLLPLFKEEDREEVKFRMLGATVGDCAYRMARDLSNGLKYAIEMHTEQYGVVSVRQELIVIWTAACNVTDAWIAEALPYRKALQLHNHNADRARVKAGTQDKVVYKHPDKCQKQWHIESPTHYLNDFLIERQLALNPPLKSSEEVNVKFNSVNKMFAYGSQLTFAFVAMCNTNVETKDNEHLKLLGEYEPKYSPPKSVAANAVDNEIVLQEKYLVQLFEKNELLSFKELLQLTEDSIKLLSLLHMRYKNSIEARDEYTYFRYFTSPTLSDKNRYYEIFAFYLDNIIQKCLTPILKLTKEQADISEDELAKVKRSIDDVKYFSCDVINHASNSAKVAIRILSEIKRLNGEEVLLVTQSEPITSELRQRNLRRVEPE